MADNTDLQDLTDQRSALFAELQRAHERVAQLHLRLRELDAQLHQLNPGLSLPTVPPARLPGAPKISSTLIRGAVSAACLKVLSEANGAEMSSRAIADAIIANEGLKLASKREVNDFTSSVTVALSRHAKRGLVRKVAGEGNKLGSWKLANATAHGSSGAAKPA